MYLVDGNNVIGQRAKGYENWYRDKSAARRQFLNDVAALVQTKKLRITVVFDGAPDHSFPDGASFRGVKVFYARPGSDADTRIVEMAEAERNKKNLTVITSDRKLTDRVRVCGVAVLRSGDFRKMMEEAADSAPSPSESQIKAEEADDWLRYFGVDDTDDEP